LGKPPLLAVALALALTSFAPGDASAQGLLDFLFGSPRQPAPPPPAAAPEPQRAPVAATPSAPSGGGRSHAFCVRLCDGRYFPIQQSNTTPEKLCGMLCPASQTKIFYGGDIEHASGRDGSRYAGLPNAYLFRKREVANCTCNGRNSFGLAQIDAASDPSLRRGDVVVQPDPHSTTR
jgi:hypothetical protein